MSSSAELTLQPLPLQPHSHRDGIGTLALGALGVVFGDIGTSPIYAFHDALALAAKGGLDKPVLLGVLSLALWALLIVVAVKYVMFLMRADNNGEGGVLALMALAGRVAKRSRLLVVALGAAGAALFYGDGIITPALSVLSAVEGLESVPALQHDITHPVVLIVALAILVALFSIQSRGTARVAKLFGPICLVWFFVLTALGLKHILDAPAIFAALDPVWGILFLVRHGVAGLFVLGAVFLTVTGAEALTADMGHFGRRPIQLGWFTIVFPALVLNYLGQGALALRTWETAQAAHVPFESQSWFFVMAPESLRVPLVVLAVAATVIASQAVITGAFSLTQQAIQLGLLPRMTIRQTSASQAGQIYLPLVNVLLFVGVVVLVVGFRSSSRMAAAYGISVTGTMVVTTCLAFVIVWRLWQWRLSAALALILPFLALDTIFFGANILRVIEGGWVPLVVAGAIGLVIATWLRGRALMREALHGEAVDQPVIVASVEKKRPPEVPGTAIFFSASLDLAPLAFLHNLKHNKIMHERNLFVTVVPSDRPAIAHEERVKAHRLSEHFVRVGLRYGFMERPNVPRDLKLFCEEHDIAFDPMATSYFISRLTVHPADTSAMPRWRRRLFMFLQRNAADPTAFYQIPPNRTLEMGAQVVV